MKKNLFLGKWLLVAIILMISSPLSIGRGGGGSGGGGKKSTPPPECNNLEEEPIDVRLVLPPASSIPNRNRFCSFVPDLTCRGGTTNVNNTSIYCKINVKGTRCKDYSKDYFLIGDFGSNIPIKVPRNTPFSISIEFLECCGNCTPYITGRSKFTSARTYQSHFEISFVETFFLNFSEHLKC